MFSFHAASYFPHFSFSKSSKAAYQNLSACLFLPMYFEWALFTLNSFLLLHITYYSLEGCWYAFYFHFVSRYFLSNMYYSYFRYFRHFSCTSQPQLHYVAKFCTIIYLFHFIFFFCLRALFIFRYFTTLFSWDVSRHTPEIHTYSLPAMLKAAAASKFEWKTDDILFLLILYRVYLPLEHHFKLLLANNKLSQNFHF